MSNQVHPSAQIADNVEMGDGNIIEANARIESDVKLGNGNKLEFGAVLKQGARIQDNNHLFEYAVIGGTPQDVKFDPNTALSYLDVGSDNIFREYSCIHRSSTPGESTKMGNKNFMMCNTHIGHDSIIGDNNIFVVSCGVGGHVTVENNALIAGGVMIHQFSTIGSYAMLGGNAKITLDCLPYVLVDGHPAYARGLNITGLKRAGFSNDDIRALKTAYRILFSDSGQSLEDKFTEIAEISNPPVQHLLKFARESKRGFHRK